MCQIQFIREKKIMKYEQPVTIAKAAADAMINIGDGLCGFKKCGKCKVIVTKGNDRNYSKEEDEILSKEDKARGIRLACCYEPSEDVAVMTISNGYGNFEKSNISSSTVNAGDDIKVAIDIGTTTVEVYAYSGEDNPIASINGDNPLRIIGNDVISRIAYATNHDKLLKMNKMLINFCDSLLNEIVNTDRIKEIVITGNTTMMHIATGRDIDKLGKSPFTTGYMGGEIVLAKELGFKVNDECKIIIPYFIGEHVGADAMCCVYGCNILDDDKPALIMDIGTNSEMILVDKERMYACSAPAGPAFESSNIRCGMKIGYGALTHVRMTDDSLLYDIYGVGNGISSEDKRCTQLKGMCASALIDLIAILIKKGTIDGYGTLQNIDGKNVFYLSKKYSKVLLTQEDIRNVQMAKGAIMAAIDVMLSHSMMTVHDIKKIHLAGNFGNNIEVVNAVRVGLVPDAYVDRFILDGNAAAKGALRLLYEKNLFGDMKKLSKQFEHISLGENEVFKKRYIEDMNFYNM